MQPITLTLDLVNGVLGYLGSRPYAEVEKLVEAIKQQALPQLQKPEKTPEA